MSAAPPDYETLIERAYRSFLKEGDNCVDIGAHAGRHLFPMLHVIGSKGKVLAFEPIPRLADALQSNIDLLGWGENVDLRCMALSNEDGTTTFNVAEDAPGFSGLLKRTYDVPTRITEIEVTLGKLDNLARDFDSLRYVKLDAQGAEWLILQGAVETIRRLRPIVSFEFGEASYGAYGVNPADVYDFFAALNFDVLDVLGRKLDRAQFSESSRHQALWDYFAVSRVESQRLADVLTENS